MAETTFNLKQLTNWGIIILIAVFSASATSSLQKDSDARNDSKTIAIQQVQINGLLENQTNILHLIETMNGNISDIHDNVLTLMITNKVKPVKP